jgi:hypothetical protein
MGLPVDVRLVAYRGDSWSQHFRFLRDSVPVDLTDATVESWARADAEVVELQVDVDDPASGTVAISAPADGLAAQTWDYDVEVTESGGDITTWVRGTLTVRPDVTNASAS